MKLQRSPYPILVAGFIAPIFVCGFFMWLPTHLNDLRLSAFANNLYDYPLPPSTTIVSQHSELAKLGNGSNCYYRVEQSMTSTLSRAEIENYYKNVMLPKVSFGQQWDGLYGSPTVMEIDLDFDEQNSVENVQYFTLELFDVGIDVTLDIRCH
jgi:hypothetical protein